MYRVKQDKRVIKSAEKIKEGLLRKLKSRPFNDISVSDIAHESGVCRATFYRLFDTPTDVLAYACDSFAIRITSLIKENFAKMDRDSFLRFILTSWIDQADLIDAVVKSGRPIVLFRALRVIFDDVVSYGDQFNDDEKDYIQSSLAAQFGSILFVWIQHGRRESADVLLRLFKRFAAATSSQR